MSIFQRRESEVRSYCRSFPTVFESATGYTLVDEHGKEYIDFFAGAGVLNYGHNNPALKQRLIEYIAADGITHSLDKSTVAKRDFLETFEEVILEPRNLDYKVMFPGPTGTNAVESALKLARKVTGRSNVIAFTNGFHGMTLGSLAMTGNAAKRQGAGVTLTDATHMPFCSYFGPDTDTISHLESFLLDGSSGIEAPAAFIVETVQAEGGVNVASREWMQRLQSLSRKVNALLIVDDIQVGCGRTGTFFSFEKMGIDPDIVTLSKSLSGYGLPFAVTLMKPEFDIWEPGEHNGTFRGHNLAFVTATEAIRKYWTNDKLTKHVNALATKLRDHMLTLAGKYQAEVRGRGLIQGIEFADSETAGLITKAAFQRGLVIETSGPRGEVLKALPPLILDETGLDKAMRILHEAAEEVHEDRSVSDELGV